MYLLDITLIVTNDYQLINMIFSGLIDYAIKLFFLIRIADHSYR